MSLLDHAKRELELAGNDEDFNQSILKAVEAFVEYGHSGGSAPVAIEILTKLLEFKNITPLTSDPNEWQKIPEEIARGLWQSHRRADAFSRDGGRTYHLLDKPEEVFETIRMWEGKENG